MTSANAFVLVYKEKYFIWIGKLSPEEEINYARTNQSISSQTVIEMKEGKETAEFWSLLGADPSDLSSIYYPLRYDQSMSNLTIEPRLFHCSSATGAFTINEVVDYTQDDLDTNDVFILDAVIAIFVWVGKQVLDREIRWSMEASLVSFPPLFIIYLYYYLF